MTSRTKRYGNPGDTFVAFGARFEITAIARVRLLYVADHHCFEEGVADRDEFIKLWSEIHPVKGYDGMQWVFLHSFKRVSGVSV